MKLKPETLRKLSRLRSTLYLKLVLPALLLLAACATQALPPTSISAQTEVACEAFSPIRYSTRDTLETQEQARGHNAAWDALCLKD